MPPNRESRWSTCSTPLATGAAEALARTPELLPVLAQAGVVDAGGSGYLLIFDALLSVVDGRAIPDPPELPDNFNAAIAVTHGGGGSRSRGFEASALAGLRYEVMYLLEAADETIPSFKEVWAGIGDSIVVVGGDGMWNCHIHTDDIGAAVEAALDAGRPQEDPGDRPPGAGGGGAVGPRGGGQRRLGAPRTCRRALRRPPGRSPSPPGWGSGGSSAPWAFTA